ncbi:MAG: MMPL family transporter [Pseudomonadales bacterium]|nr:MMPL family transporter [Pseudomonadales bacterium]
MSAAQSSPQTNPFVHLGRYLLRYPKTALSLIILQMLILMSALPRMTVDTSAEGFLYDNAEPIVRYDAFRQEFGRDEFFVVAITGVDVFSLAFLEKLEMLHRRLEQRLDKLQKVESLVNVRSIYGEGDDLIAEELLETMPVDAAEVAIIKQRVQAKPVYYDRLINRDETAVAVMVKLIPFVQTGFEDGEAVYENLSEEEIYAAYNDILAIVAEVEDQFPENSLHVGGTQAIGSYMGTVLQKDFGQFTAVALLMVMVFLWTLFRRVSGVLIPIMVMIIGIVSCISLMVWMGFPMQITSSILPSFLLAVCVGDSVHLLSIFYHQYDSGDSKEGAILHALEHTGTAVLFTTLTTAAGLLTFATSEIRPVASLGLFAAIGSVVAFSTTILLIPVLLKLFSIKHKQLGDGQSAEDFDPTHMNQNSPIYKFTQACIFLAANHPKKISAFAVSLMVAACLIVPQIRFAQDALEWFPDDTPTKLAVQTIEREITGSLPFEIMIDSGEKQGVLDPAFLQRLDDWVESLKTTTLNGVDVVTASGLTTLIKETHQAMHNNSLDEYRVPNDRELIAQELLLIELDQADDLFQFTNKEFSKTRVTIIMPWGDSILFAQMQKELEQHYADAMGDMLDDYPIQITGVIPVFSKMFTSMISSAATSYFFAFAVICIMMITLLRSPIDGLISMIPNLLPILLVLSFMTIVDIPLDVFTVLIGSIALGLCVDDTVHFMHGFKSAYKKHGDTLLAIEQTLFSTGKAMLITTVVLVFGFLTFTLSELKNMDLFGVLTAACIFMALLADFLIAPALMIVRYGIKTND